jgi:hypothetical protein
MSDRTAWSSKLRPGKPPERRTELRRHTPLRPFNRERKARRYARDFGDHAQRIRQLPCDLCGAPPPSDPHHAKSRGAGGTKRHLIPLCRKHHRRIHDGHGPDREHLMERADYYWTRYGG